jgi:adenine phosphoribosyltransferase
MSSHASAGAAAAVAVSSTAALIPEDDTRRAQVMALAERHPDFPKPGILFIDVLPVFRHPAETNIMISAMARAVTAASGADIIYGVESRGFIFAPLVARELGLPFAPVRKAGKLPGACLKREYDLEYGSAVLELQQSAAAPGGRAIVCDDLLATGGTLGAACALVRAAGMAVAGCVVIVELQALGGAARVDAPVWTYVKA